MIFLFACVAPTSVDSEKSIPLPDAVRWCLDADADGYGGLDPCVEAEAAPAGYVDDASDCNDAASDVFPGATEHCDDRDEDCDGVVDNDAEDATATYADADGDGAGRDDATSVGCVSAAWASVGGDCDDNDPTISPFARDLCLDGVDSDCDGVDVEWCGPLGDESLATAETRLLGDTTTLEYGWNLAMVGDVDGDGFGEVADGLHWVNAVNVATPERGSTLMVASEAATIHVGGPPDQINTLGDLDGDGASEFSVGGFDGDPGILIFQGEMSGTLSSADAVAAIDPTGVSDHLYGARTIRDNDGDGIADLVVQDMSDVTDTTGQWGEYVGELRVVPGPFAGTTMLTDAVARISPSGWNQDGQFGASLCVSDLDGDGVDDIAAGAPAGLRALHPSVEGGAVYTAFGPFLEERTLDDSAGGLVDGDALWGWAGGATAPLRAGWSLSCGDTDADGYPELLVGSLDGYGSTGDGAAWLLPGHATGAFALAEAPWSIVGSASAEILGLSVTLESDLDADGQADLVIGSAGASKRGLVAMFYGTTLAGAVDVSAADATWTGEADGDYAAVVAGGDDLDADGFQDILIGAANHVTDGVQGGAIYVIYGGG